MKAIAFLGPSLTASHARSIAGVEIRPPARCGDLLRAMRDRDPEVIAIVDGVFESVPSVWHKEILYAISRGVVVLGSSSMGALRAAELHAFGMIGIGAVFEAYRDGVYEDDDEVALLHGPEHLGYHAYSVPMVNLREGLARAAADRIVGARDAGELAREMKELFYAHRSWQALYAAADRRGLGDRLRRFVESTRPDVKRDDAVALFERLAALETKTWTPARVELDFPATGPWRLLVHRIAGEDEPRESQFGSTETRS